MTASAEKTCPFLLVVKSMLSEYFFDVNGAKWPSYFSYEGRYFCSNRIVSALLQQITVLWRGWDAFIGQTN